MAKPHSPVDPPSRPSRKRVAFVDHSASLGGAELAMCGLLKHLDFDRWEPLVILGSNGHLEPKLRSEGRAVQIEQMPKALINPKRNQISLSVLLSPPRILATVRYVIRLSWVLRRKRVSLVHANSLRACVLAGLAGRLAGIPVVWQIHSIVSDAKMSSQAVALIRGLSRWLPDWIICNSEASAACLSSVRRKVTVVPCGVDSTLFHPNGKGRRDRARVGSIARFSPEKGQHVLVDAAELLLRGSAEIEYVLAGTAMFGEERYEQEVRSRAQRGRLGDRFEFPGFVEDVPSLLGRLDIVVHPSVEPEGFGQIVAEAMMAGKPIVGTAAGGSAELVEDGVTGRLVAPGDARALADAILDLVEHPEEAAKMGRRARDVALQRYDIRKTTRAIEDVYERALAGF